MKNSFGNQYTVWINLEYSKLCLIWMSERYFHHKCERLFSIISFNNLCQTILVSEMLSEKCQTSILTTFTRISRSAKQKRQLFSLLISLSNRFLNWFKDRSFRWRKKRKKKKTQNDAIKTDAKQMRIQLIKECWTTFGSCVRDWQYTFHSYW
jgi:hypothetical protein